MIFFIENGSKSTLSFTYFYHYRTNTQRSNRKFGVFIYLSNLFIYLFLIDNLLLFRYRREALYKTTQVLNCIRRLRSVIIRPSKLDISTEMLNCLQQVKTPKSNKKNKKT